MFLLGMFVGIFIGANIGVVMAGILMRAKLEQRILGAQPPTPSRNRVPQKTHCQIS